MHDPVVYLVMFIIIVSAKAMGELSARFGLPAVLGEVTAGIILGPSAFNVIAPCEIIDFLAELGIILFIFEVGLDSDLSRLYKAGAKALKVAVTGAVLPVASTYYICIYGLNLSPAAALFAGGTMAATSIGVTARMLQDVGTNSMGSEPGEVVMGAAVLDDVLGVLLLAVLTDFAIQGRFSGTTLLTISGSVLLIVVVVGAAASAFTRAVQVLHHERKVPGLLPGVHISLLLLFSYFSRLLSVPEILGSFAAGLFMSQRRGLLPNSTPPADPIFLELLRDRIKPMVHVITPFFFVRVGLTMDMRTLPWGSAWFWLVAGMLIVAGTLSKFASGFAATGMSRKAQAFIGVCMIPRAEVALIFAEMGRAGGLFDAPTHAAIVLAVAVTTFIPLLALRYFTAAPGATPDEEAAHDHK